MAWMKVDDGLGQHRKILSIPRIIRKQSIGVWTLAGSWVSANLTDGYVPAYYLDEIGADQIEVDALVKAGLWEAVEEGFQFHDWLDVNPSKVQVMAERRASADRQKRARERAAEKRRDEQSRRDCPPYGAPPEHDDADPSRRDSRRTSGGVTVPPTQPNPTQPNPELLLPTPDGAGVPQQTQRRSLDDHFADWWAVYPLKKGKGAARTAWDKARQRESTAGLLAAVQKFAGDPNLPRDRSKIPWPQKWLNEERWNDDPYPAPADGSAPAVDAAGNVDPTAVLGPDRWQPPTPPEHIQPGTRAYVDWHREQWATHNAERQAEAEARLARRSA